MVRTYYEMPDKATQDMIAAMGDTIEIIPRPVDIWNPGAAVVTVDPLSATPYTSPGTPGVVTPGSLPMSAYAPEDAAQNVALADAYYAAFRAGDVAGVHAALDAWNAYRRTHGMADKVADASDQDIAANALGFNPATTEGRGVIVGGQAVYPGQPGYPTAAAAQAGISVTTPLATAPAGSVAPETTGGTYTTPQSNAPIDTGSTGGTGAGGGGGSAAPYSIMNAVLQASGLGPSERLSPDQWAWYWMQVTGLHAPAPENYGYVGANRNMQVTCAEWWANFQTAAGAGSGTPGTGAGSGTPGTGGGGGGTPGTGGGGAAPGGKLPLAAIVVGGLVLWALLK